jgi:hypothetical protein
VVYLARHLCNSSRNLMVLIGISILVCKLSNSSRKHLVGKLINSSRKHRVTVFLSRNLRYNSRNHVVLIRVIYLAGKLINSSSLTESQLL